MNDKRAKIFINEWQGKKLYTASISKKDKDGKYINGYINVRFKNDADIKDGDVIKITNSFLDFYVKDKVTHIVFMILDYEKLETKQKEEKQENDPFAEFGEQVSIDEFGDDYLE